jgi:hypothetical protein
MKRGRKIPTYSGRMDVLCKDVALPADQRAVNQQLDFETKLVNPAIGSMSVTRADAWNLSYPASSKQLCGHSLCNYLPWLS